MRKHREAVPQVVFHDIDGCLNPAMGTPIGAGDDLSMAAAQRSVLARVDAAIEASAVEHVVIATGRRLADTLFVAEQLPTSKLRYLLVESGAVAYDRVAAEHLDLGAIAASRGLSEVATPYADLSQVLEVIAWYRAGGQQRLEAVVGSALAEIPKQAMLTLRVADSVSETVVLDEL